MKKYIIIFFVLLLLNTSLAAESESIKFSIVKNSIVVEDNIDFGVKKQFLLGLPDDARGISLYLDDSPADYKDYAINNKISASAQKVKASYVTSKFMHDNNFLIDLSLIEDTKRLTVTLISDEEQLLEKPIEYETMSSNAIFPKPTTVTSDGRRLYIIWERQNVKVKDILSFFVIFEKKTGSIFLILSIVIMIMLALILFFYLRKPKIKTKVRVIKKVKQVKTPIEKYLKEDEEQIVNILKQRGGQCEQGTLVVVTGFSKAKLSSLIKELEERNIVYKEQKGKKNVIYLKE